MKSFVIGLACLPFFVVLAGCGLGFTSQLSTDAEKGAIVDGLPFGGNVMGGQQPITSSHLYVYAADSTAYGHASDSLIKNQPAATYPSHIDASGNYYVITDPTSGNFSLDAGQYQCAVGSQVYLYLIGGNTGLGSNSAISEIAILGTCNTSGGFSQLTGGFVYMNEVSTVAAAYALAGFATDATHVASSSSGLAGVDITNAFNNAPNIYNINAGANKGALTNTPQGSGTVPQAEVNSLADIIASCINSSGPTSANCSTLLANATDSSNSSPSETASAMINIAHSPGKNVSTLFTLFNNASPFQPSLSSAPPDYSIVLTFANGSSSQPADIAIDANGDVWVTNNNLGSVTELSSTGKILSGTGYTYASSGLAAPTGIAIDQGGNAWVADSFDNLIEIAPGGASTSSYTGTDLTASPIAVAVDANGNVWVAQNSTQAVQFSPRGVENFATSGGALRNQNVPGSIAIDTSNNAFIANYTEDNRTAYSSVSEFNSSGIALSSGTGYGYSLAQNYGQGIAMDASGNFWMTNKRQGSITIGNNSGSSVSLASGSSSAGLSSPAGIAFDGAGNAWVANSYGTISELNSSGQAVTTSTGYSGTTNLTMSGITTIAIDGSGNLWTTNASNGNIYEFLGSTTPVVTPLSAALSSPYKPASRP